MEHLLRRNLETSENNSPQKALLQALSLISNPSTSNSTLSSISNTLILTLKTPNSNPFIHHHILRLFSLLKNPNPNLTSALRQFSSSSTRSLADTLACSNISVNDEESTSVPSTASTRSRADELACSNVNANDESTLLPSTASASSLAGARAITNADDESTYVLSATTSTRSLADARACSNADDESVFVPSTTSTRSLADAFACLLSISDSNNVNVNDVSTFLSLVFKPCVSVRHWLLLNVSRFEIRPSVLLTVLLGFTKDPYPDIRNVALIGLADLCKCVLVEDGGLIRGCYFRAVEFLFDFEDSVRCSAVRAVSACGQLIVSSTQGRSKGGWSDALFLQLCSVVRDMSVEVRVEVFNALGKIEIVSEYILLQMLYKKASSATNKMDFPGQYSEKLFRIPATSASFAFLHGLEDDFVEVRESACRALRTLAILSAEFSKEVVNLLMDALNDDSVAVRLQALDTMHHMAMFGHLKVQQERLHMFLWVLLDSHSLIRCTARKVLKLTELPSLDMFKMCVNGLIRDLELYPQDEAEVFSALFMIGQNHGKFLVSLINEVSQMIEPSSGGKLGYDNVRKASYLVLATSAPVSLKQRTCSIPPRIFSYAVTLLGRVSRSLADIVDQRTLLAYLSYCSRFTFVSASEFFKMEEQLEKGDVLLTQRREISKYHAGRKLQLKEAESSHLDFQIEHNKEINCVNIMLQVVIDIWPSLKLGLIDEVTQTRRSLKAELGTISNNNHRGGLVFALQYIDALERLGHLWSHLVFSKEFYFHEWGKLECSLNKLDRCLRDMRYKLVGLTKEDNFLILELIIAHGILTLCNIETCANKTTLKKLHSVISCIEHICGEGSTESSNFLVEVQKSLSESNTSSCPILDNPYLLLKSLEYFTPRKVVTSRNLKYMEAELHCQGNEFQNPLPFISGLPVGVSLDITLHNISSENMLWIKMSLEEKLTQFVFLDLHETEGHDELRKFTFVAPFYQTPKANYFSLKICIVLECMSDDERLCRSRGGPKHEVAHLCEEKEVYFSVEVR
ncbi:protein SIEL isoform X2 [Lycium barbarum]|uniref:protein SIEL isoform X2 n=1 Tax=Lycium barbarum TaxID=112863 RepID=UPI00293E84B5|nr:protein SIEL isoform X2 [Lycium barbarum]